MVERELGSSSNVRDSTPRELWNHALVLNRVQFSIWFRHPRMYYELARIISMHPSCIINTLLRVQLTLQRSGQNEPQRSVKTYSQSCCKAIQCAAWCPLVLMFHFDEGEAVSQFNRVHSWQNHRIVCGALSEIRLRWLSRGFPTTLHVLVKSLRLPFWTGSE